MPPLAVSLQPDPFPLRFTEVIAFSGDFDNVVMPGETVNPKGVVYHSGLNRVIVSLSPFHGGGGEKVQILNAVASDGSRFRFAPTYNMFRQVESKLAIVPASGPPIQAGFTPGDLFVGRGPNNQISRLSNSGEVIADVWADLGIGGGLWGGLGFDTSGTFGGHLIAVGAEGKIFSVVPNGQFTLLKDLGLRLEGVAIAPPGFGPVAGQIIVGVEGYGDDDPHGGEIYALSPSGSLTLLANIGYAAEDIQFVPADGGTYFQAELCFDRERENRLLTVSSSQFLNRLGKMLIVNEMTGELWEVAWDGSRYTQALAGRVPGRWSSSGFATQGTELEAGCFSVRKPAHPKWTDWEPLPGARTDSAPAAGVDAWGNLHLLVKGLTDGHVYLNSLMSGTRNWRGWTECPPGGLITPYPLASALHNNIFYIFAVSEAGTVLHKPLNLDQSQPTAEPWQEVPGNLITDAAVAATAADGRLVLCAKGKDQQIYLNELSPGGRPWSGWYGLPGGGNTQVTPALATFQDELYVLISEPVSARIRTKVRSVNGRYTAWSEIPGPGLTLSPITATSPGGQLHLFVRGVDNAPYYNIASETGTWSHWHIMPNPGVTDTSMASATVGGRIFLFAKGVVDRQLYVRQTRFPIRPD